jgi:hypothetical protein
MKNIFKKTILFALVAALAVASLPFVTHQLWGSMNRLSRRTESIQRKVGESLGAPARVYERMGRQAPLWKKFGIDRSRQREWQDVSAVQSALDAFEALKTRNHLQRERDPLA